MKSAVTGILLLISFALYGQGIMLAVDPTIEGTVIEDTRFSTGQDGWSTTGTYEDLFNYIKIYSGETISKSFDLSSYTSVEVAIRYSTEDYTSTSEALFEIETNLVADWCVTGCDGYPNTTDYITFEYTGPMDSSTFFEFEQTGAGSFWLWEITITAY